VPSTFKILVVEDYEPLRRFFCLTLQKRADFQVVEASDGLEAIQKADAVKPDLILFDLGLPKLNGIEAARRVRNLPSAARILFVSQESSPDIVQEALGTDAQGYVHKLRASSELMPAIDAVLNGKNFVSSGLMGPQFSEIVNRRSVETKEPLTRPTGNEHKSREQVRDLGKPRYPWQLEVIDALQSARNLLPVKISRAERAIARKLLFRNRLDLEEQLALIDALRSLEELLSETLDEVLSETQHPPSVIQTA
jgi:DNA-binding NarL/FixJ family response regulator